jgi:hypothetical protein
MPGLLYRQMLTHWLGNKIKARVGISNQYFAYSIIFFLPWSVEKAVDFIRSFKTLFHLAHLPAPDYSGEIISVTPQMHLQMPCKF